MIAIITTSLILIVIAALLILGLVSKSGEANGLVESRLSPCPDKPNCVCSEFEADADHFIEPLAMSSDAAAEVMTRLKKIIEEMGGKVQRQSDDYLAATFSSAIFRFVDDLEIRIDRETSLIHLRSASRVGHGDGGVNRQRIQQLKKLYRAKYN